MKKLLSIILLIGASTFAAERLCAQNFEIDTVRFQTSGYTDLNDSIQRTVISETQFVYYGGSHIRWIQEEGAVVYAMDIINTSGTALPNVLDETATTNVKLNGGITGSFMLRKTASGIALFLELNGGTSPIRVRYTVTSIDTL